MVRATATSDPSTSSTRWSRGITDHRMGFYRHLGRVLGIAGFPVLRRRAEAHAATKDLAGI
jgi:hypothetical protein